MGTLANRPAANVAAYIMTAMIMASTSTCCW
jgi:hypothetical protein